jgi:NCS1 family nucleobase:cation symporter-1
MATVTERLERALEREAPAWDVRPVPWEKRQLSGVDLALLWADLGIGLLVLVTGALLVPALGLRQAFLAILVGSVLGCVPLALVGLAGAREGIPGMVLLRPVLGARGSYLPTVLNIAQLLGWTAFELWAMAVVATRAVRASALRAGQTSGPLTGPDFYVWLGVVTAVCLLLSLGGPVLVVRRWLKRFGAWILAAAAAWVTFRVLGSVRPDLSTVWSRPGSGGLPFWTAVDLVIVMPVSWIPLVADYNRFARRPVNASVGTYAGYFVANVWFYTLGAILVATPLHLALGVAGIADAIWFLGGGTVVLAILLVGETDQAFADVYSAAVSAQNLAPRLPQRAAILGVSALGVAGAVWLFGQPDEGIQSYEFFLFLIGSIFVPLFGVFVADYFVVNRTRPYRSARPGELHATALGAWFAGFVVYHWLVPTGPRAWQAAVEWLFEALRLPFPLLGGEAPASIIAFGAAFGIHAALGGLHRRTR